MWQVYIAHAWQQHVPSFHGVRSFGFNTMPNGLHGGRHVLILFRGANQLELWLCSLHKSMFVTLLAKLALFSNNAKHTFMTRVLYTGCCVGLACGLYAGCSQNVGVLRIMTGTPLQCVIHELQKPVRYNGWTQGVCSMLDRGIFVLALFMRTWEFEGRRSPSDRQFLHWSPALSCGSAIAPASRWPTCEASRLHHMH